MIATTGFLLALAAVLGVALLGFAAYAFGRSRLAKSGGFSPIDRRAMPPRREVASAVTMLNGAISGGVLMSDVPCVILSQFTDMTQSFVIDELNTAFGAFMQTALDDNASGYVGDELLIIRRRDWLHVTRSHYMFADVTRSARDSLRSLLLVTADDGQE